MYSHLILIFLEIPAAFIWGPLPGFPLYYNYDYSLAGFLTVSSMLKIVLAASQAAAKAFYLIKVGSQTNSS